MKVTALITWGVIGCLLIATAAAAEQPTADRPGSNPGGSQPGEGRQPVIPPRHPGFAPGDPRSFEAIKLWRMTQALDLSEEQASKIFPKLHQMQKERRQFRQNYRLMVQDLAALVRTPDVKDNFILKKIEEIEKVEQSFREQERKGREEIKAILTPLQQAKLMLFQERFDRDLRAILREMREQRGPLPPRHPSPKMPPEPPQE